MSNGRLSYEQREAAAAVTNIENALLQLEVFGGKREAALDMIDQRIEGLEEGGVEERDAFRHDFWKRLRTHFREPGRELLPDACRTEDTRDERQLCLQALEVQDACNLTGVVYAYARNMKRLRELFPGQGTDFFNTHPVAVLFADKCRHLAGDAIAEAYQQASRKVNHDGSASEKDE